MLDVRRGPVHARVELESGEAGLHLADGVLDTARHRERVRVRQLLDHEQEAVAAAAQDRIADQRLVSSTTVETSPSVRFFDSWRRTLARSSGVLIGRRC